MKGNSSNTSSNQNDDQNGDSQDPDVMPPDVDSGVHKARERGRWIAGLIIKGGASGTFRAVVEKGLEHLENLDF